MFQSLLKTRSKHIVLTRNTIIFCPKRKFSYEKRIQRAFNDGIDVKHQTVEINSIEHIRRCSFYKDVDIWSFYKAVYPDVRTLGDGLHQGYIASKDGPCVGYLETFRDKRSLKWLSYSTVIERSRLIGSYLWKKNKLTPMQSKVAILSFNRPEYFFVEQACYMYGFIVVSLYTTYDSKAILNVLQRTQAEVIVIDNLERIKPIQNELLNNKQIKEILVFDDTNYEENDKIQFLSNIFKTMKSTDICERPKVDSNSVATLVLTSGTTGEPKIVMISHDNLLSAVKGHLMRLDRANVREDITNRHCSFLPLAHIFERFTLLQSLLRGAQFVFCPAPEQLISYLSIVKPTQASVVPRILNRVYDAIMTEVNKSAIKRYLFQQALRERPSFLSYFVFRKVKTLFGGEIKGIIAGSAPINQDVLRFFRIALDTPIMAGYGQTESSGAGATSHPTDMSYNTVGTPIPTVEIKLIDIPDMNYKSEMNQGEVCIRGPTIFKGYYDDETATRETIDKDGWLHTGDVGEWTSNGTLRIIDRTKHIFKLSQGKYIAPERLEDVYIRSQWVAQIFVDGISSEESVVAIVVPDEQYVRNNLQSTTTSDVTFIDLCKNVKLKEIILSDLNRLADKYKFKKYEKISKIYLHPELFSQDNELLTVTLKIRRTQARKRFQAIIKSLYETDPTMVIKDSQK